ncbi:hypothetical protein D1007_47873 [Hordeum vulgare]|nr:hypothetical protein D1007_47873 [Hordeum vulgare]
MSYSSSTTAGLSGQIAERLTRSNYILWRTQIMPGIRGTGFFGYVEGSMSEPAKEVLVQVKSIAHANEVWMALANMFSSHSLSHVNNICIVLAKAQKGNQTVTAYFVQMRSLANEIVVANKPIPDEELVLYILAGVDMEYQRLVSALDARTTMVSLDDLFAQISNFDQWVALFQQGNSGSFKSSANVRGLLSTPYQHARCSHPARKQSTAASKPMKKYTIKILA